MAQCVVRFGSPYAEPSCVCMPVDHATPQGGLGEVGLKKGGLGEVDLKEGGLGERRAQQQLAHDAAQRPHVYRGRVDLAAEQQLGRAVPERDDHVRVGLERRAVLACEPKVADLELALGVVQDVGALEVAVQHPVGVQEVHARKHLQHEVLDVRHAERARHADVLALGVHDALEVVVHELHDHEDLVSALADADFRHMHDVGVVEVEHHVDLADRRDREAVALLLHLDHLERNQAARLLLARLRMHAQARGGIAHGWAVVAAGTGCSRLARQRLNGMLLPRDAALQQC
eukprot:357715-Chlamydomonas_euryale.AAC.5